MTAIIISLIVAAITVLLCVATFFFVMVFPDEISDYLNAKTEALRAITEKMKNETKHPENPEHLEGSDAD